MRVISKSGLVENVGVEVEIASLSQAIQALLQLPLLRPPSSISGRRRRRICPWMTSLSLESPYPKMKNGGWVDTGLVSLAGPWVKLEVVQSCRPPRCSRYTIDHAFASVAMRQSQQVLSFLFKFRKTPSSPFDSTVFMYVGLHRQTSRVQKSR